MIRKAYIPLLLVYLLVYSLQADVTLTNPSSETLDVKAATYRVLNAPGATSSIPAAVLSYTWTITTTPTSATFESTGTTTASETGVSTGVRLRIPADVTGSLVVTLAVADGGVAPAATKTFTLNIVGVNQPPVAKIRSVNPNFPIVGGVINGIPDGKWGENGVWFGTEFALSAIANPGQPLESTDPDGDVLAFTWRVKSGPAPLLPFGFGDPEVNFSFPPGSGTYVMELEASDVFYATKTTVQMNVVGSGTPQPPPGAQVVNAGADKPVSSGGSVVMSDATATGFNPSEVQYEWSKVSGADVIFTSTVVSTVTNAILRPRVRVPAGTPPGPITLRLTVRDASVTKYDDVVLGVDGVFTQPSGPSISLTRTDEGGPTPPDNQRPNITSVTGLTQVNERASASWTVNAADPDPTNPKYGSGGNIGIGGGGTGGTTPTPTSVLKYAWIAKKTADGSVLALQGADTATATLVAPNVTADVLVDVTVTVKDPLDLGVKASYQVTIKDAYKAPIGKIKAVAPIKSGAKSVVLDGRETQDGDSETADGSLTYQWTQIAGPAVKALRKATEALAEFDAPDITSKTELKFKLVVSDSYDTAAAVEVKVEVNPVNLAVLIPLIAAKSSPSEPDQTLNVPIATSMALLYPPVGSPPTSGVTVRFQAKNRFGSLKEDAINPIYWGQQIGLHADNILNLPNIKSLPEPASLEAVSEAQGLKGFFLIYGKDFINMDGVTADLKPGKRLDLLGVRYKKDSTGKVVRQTHVFAFNPNPESVPISLSLVYTLPTGKLFELKVSPGGMAPNSAYFGSIDSLFPALKTEYPGFELSSTSYVKMECSAELQAMLLFEEGTDSISTVKPALPLEPAEEAVASRTLYAPFVTVSRPSSKPALEKFNSLLTLYNGDPTNDAFITVGAFSLSGLPLFPTQPEVELLLKPGSQVVYPLLKDGQNGGLFTDDTALPGPDPRNGYLEIVANKKQTTFGLRGSSNVHGFVSTKFPGTNETSIPLLSLAQGLGEAYFMHVAHQVPGQGIFRQALAILNPTDATTTVKVEVFETNLATTAADRAKLGKPAYVGRVTISGRQQLTKFIDQLVNDAQPVQGEPKPAFGSQLGGFVRLTVDNPAAKLMTFCTYFAVDESKPYWAISSLASIDAQAVNP